MTRKLQKTKIQNSTQMDLVIISNLFIILIALTACFIDIYRQGYRSWKDYLWVGIFLLLPIGFIFFHLKW